MINNNKLYNECLTRYEVVDGKLINKQNIKGNIKKVGEEAGYFDERCGYRKVRVSGKMYYTHRIIYLMHHGYMPESSLDHIDRNKTNNKIENLREVSVQCNARNIDTPVNNKTGVKGIYLKADKYGACIRVNKKKIYLGTFDNLDLAVLSRWNAEVEYGFPNCCTDSPTYCYLKNKNII